jgi:hypothetical protein
MSCQAYMWPVRVDWCFGPSGKTGHFRVWPWTRRGLRRVCALATARSTDHVKDVIFHMLVHEVSDKGSKSEGRPAARTRDPWAITPLARTRAPGSLSRTYTHYKPPEVVVAGLHVAFTAQKGLC